MGLYRKILVVLDLAQEVQPLLDQAVALACDQNANLSLLVISAPTLAAESVFGGTVPQSPSESRRVLRRTLDLIPDDVAFSYRLEPYAKKASLEREIRDGGVDLVVMSRGRRPRLLHRVADRTWPRLARPLEVPVLLL